MPITRDGTKRPREPLLQLSTGLGHRMCRIGRRLRSSDASRCGAVLEIRPFCCLSPNTRIGGHCLVGSLTGVVASKSVTEALKGWLSTDGNRAVSVNVKASLTARPTGRAVTKVGVSDPAVCAWKCRRSTDKSYPGDNRLISPKRPQRRGGLAPRCRLVTSWG